MRIPSFWCLLLLTLNIFHTLFYCFYTDFKQVNTGWVFIPIILPDTPAIIRKPLIILDFERVLLENIGH